MPLLGKQVSYVSSASPSILGHDFKEVKDSISTDPPKSNSSSIPNDVGDLQVQIEHSRLPRKISSAEHQNQDIEGIGPEYIYENEDDEVPERSQ
jgi:hypothetical protein